MITDQDLLSDTLTMLSHYGHTYQYLIDLLQAESWQQFYPLLVEIGRRDRLHNMHEDLSISQSANVQYLLTTKLVKFDQWPSINFQQVIPSLKYLRKSINYKLAYSAIHNKITNLFIVCQLLLTDNCEGAKDKQMRSQFFANNNDIFTNPECNKQSFHYQCYQKMSDYQKSLFEIVAIACQSKIEGSDFDISKKEEVIKKYVGTQSPQLFQYLLEIDSDSIDEIKAEVLNLKLEKMNNQWKLVGDCRVNRKCLTSTNLNKCLATYKYSYKYLVDNLFVENEEGIFFKFDVLQLIPMPAQEQTVFNCLLKEDEKIDELREYCKKILETALHLIEAVNNDKPFFYYKDGQIKAIEKEDHEKIIFFCLKMLSYPFRTYHRKINDQNVYVNVELQQIRAPLLAYMKRYQSQESIISLTVYNSLCQMFIWIDESQNHLAILQPLYTKEENVGTDEFGLHYLKILIKYLNQNKQKQLPYHVGIWFLGYFAKQAKTNILLKEYYKQLCLKVYRFLAKSRKYFKIERYEMNQYNFNSQHKKTYYDMIELLLKNNPELVAITLSQWMKELQYFQQSKSILDRSRTYRIAFLVIVFNCQHFPVTEQIKERMRKLIVSYDYQKLSFKNYKEIWTAFANKVELPLAQLISTNLEQLLKITQDYEILSRHSSTKLFRAYVSEEAQKFVRKCGFLNLLLNITTTALSEQVVLSLIRLFLRMNIIWLKNMEARQVFASQQTIQSLQRLQQLVNAYFQSNYLLKWQQSICLLKEYLETVNLSIPTNNAIVVQLGTYLRYIKQNHQNPYSTYELLNQLTALLRRRSSNQKCQLFPQFYNYYKKESIQLMENLFQSYSFNFDDYSDPSNERNVIQYSLRLKKEGKNVLEEREKLSICHLEIKAKKFIGQLLTNQNWEYTLLINNTKYDRVNTIKLFEKSVQYDFAKRLLNTFSPQKLLFFHRLYNIIDSAYHKSSHQNLECVQSTFDIALPQEPIKIFTRAQQLTAYYQAYTELIKESFKHYQQCEDSKRFEQFCRYLINSFDAQENIKLKKQLLKQLIKQLEQILFSDSLILQVFEKIHVCINLVLEGYEQPIGQFLTKQLVQTYVDYISKLVKNQTFKDKKTNIFLRFLQRLIPQSWPETADEAFRNYTITTVSVCTELIKSIDSSEIEIQMISLLKKIIRFDHPFFNPQIVSLMKNFQSMNDKFSYFICEIMEKDLRLASIELEIKCFFLKLRENNNEDWDKAKIKIQDFITILSKNHIFHKKEFIQVVETLTKKESVKQKDKQANYLRLSQVDNIQYSIYLKCRFMDFEFNGIYKAILASYIENINKDPNFFVTKVMQLRIIIFNYPLLASYILMHPITQGQVTIPLVDYLYKRITTQDFEKEVYDLFAYTAFDLCHIFNFNGKTIFFSQYLCYRLAYKTAETQLTNRNIIFIFYMVKLRRFANYCFVKIKDGKSLYQMLWERLKSTREQFVFKQNANIILYLTIGLLSRWSVHKNIISFCECRRNSLNRNRFSGFTNHCLYPLKGLVLKKQYEQLQLLEPKGNIEKEQVTFEGIQHLFAKFYMNIKENIQTRQDFDTKISIKPEYLKYIGSFSKYPSQKYFDIQSFLNNSYDYSHRYAFQPILACLSQHPNQNNDFQSMNYKRCTLYENIQGQENDNDDQNDDNQVSNEQGNANRQSRFVPEQFSIVNCVSNENDDSHFQGLVRENKEEEFTHQMQKSLPLDSGAMEAAINKTQSERPKCIKSSQLPAAIFDDLTDQQLYEVILSYYYQCNIFPISNYFIPFLQNKRIQEKVINTLLYIYHHPFDNQLFPDKLYSYDLQTSKWVAQEILEENIKEIHQKITQTFMNCIKHSFYEQYGYMNRKISRKGIKDIVFEPSHQIQQNGETYRPIYQFLQLYLKEIQNASDQDCSKILSLFRGLKQIKDSHIDNLLTILQRIHARSINKCENQGENITQSEIHMRMNDEKDYQISKNLGEILKIQKVRKALRVKFPIDDPERDPFLVSLFMDTDIYTKEQIMNLNRALIEKDQTKSSNIYFISKAFELYSQEDIKQCTEIKNSKKVIPYLLKTLQSSFKLKDQPFYKICDFPDLLSLEFKTQVLYRKVKEYKYVFSQFEREQVVAQRNTGMFQSAFLSLWNKSDSFWYMDFSVKFKNVLNVPLSGQGRGVAKNWYAYVTKDMVNLNYCAFMKTSKNYYFFNRGSQINPRHLQFLQFIGKLFAISIINKEMYLEPSFSILLYKMIVGEKIEIADIVKEFDEGEVIKDIEKLKEKEQIYNTIINGVQQQFNAFMLGFKRVVKPDFIKDITAEELRGLAQGCDKIQIEDLKKNINLGLGMSEYKQLEWFWNILEKLSAREMVYLVQYWTGLPKISPEGFKGTKLTIEANYNGKLVAETCLNKLIMPDFQSQDKMEEAIRMAINTVQIGQSIED